MPHRLAGVAPRRVAVGFSDCAYAGHHVSYLVGPLAESELSATLLKRLAYIAEHVPGGRVGLIPSNKSARWTLDPTCGHILVTTDAGLNLSDPVGVVRILNSEGRLDKRTPLRIHVEGRWLYLNFDHGLGGGRLFGELIAALGAAEPGFSQPLPASACGSPGLRAAIHSLREAPFTFAKAAIAEPFRRASTESVADEFHGDATIAYARSRAGYLDNLRDLRDRRFRGVSVSSVITAYLLRALDAQGIALEADLNVIVDLHRYLPPDIGTFSNFIGIAAIPITRPYAPTAISETLRAYTDSYRLLARYGMSYAAAKLNSRSGAARIRRGDNARARVVVTDHCSGAAARKIRWDSDIDQHVFIRQAPVGVSNQITLAINRVGSELHLTASYFDSEFNARSVQAALDSVVALDHVLDHLPDTEHRFAAHFGPPTS